MLEDRRGQKIGDYMVFSEVVWLLGEGTVFYVTSQGGGFIELFVHKKRKWSKLIGVKLFFFFFLLCWWRNNSTITSTTNQSAEQQPAQLHCFRHQTATSESFLSVDTADFTSVSAVICVCVCAAECCPADAAVFAVSKYPTVTAREEQRQSNYCSGRCRCVWAATARLFSKCFLSFWRVACNQGAENVHLQMIKLILVVPRACLAPLLIFSACAEAFLWLLVLVCVELPCKGATDCIWLWLTTLHCDVLDY